MNSHHLVPCIYPWFSGTFKQMDMYQAFLCIAALLGLFVLNRIVLYG